MGKVDASADRPVPEKRLDLRAEATYFTSSSWLETIVCEQIGSLPLLGAFVRPFKDAGEATESIPEEKVIFKIHPFVNQGVTSTLRSAASYTA